MSFSSTLLGSNFFYQFPTPILRGDSRNYPKTALNPSRCLPHLYQQKAGQCPPRRIAADPRPILERHKENSPGISTVGNPKLRLCRKQPVLNSNAPCAEKSALESPHASTGDINTSSMRDALQKASCLSFWKPKPTSSPTLLSGVT